jgi:hypothetical protein
MVLFGWWWCVSSSCWLCKARESCLFSSSFCYINRMFSSSDYSSLFSEICSLSYWFSWVRRERYSWVVVVVVSVCLWDASWLDRCWECISRLSVRMLVDS